MMKLTKILGLALAGAAALSAGPASAQIQTEPYYLGLRLLYSDQSIDVGSSQYQVTGAEGAPGSADPPLRPYNPLPNFNGSMPGGGMNKDGMGGAIAAGYDFYPYYQTPIRLELEFSGRGKQSQNFGTGYDERVYNPGFNPDGSGMLTQSGWYSQRVETTVYTLFVNALVDFRNDTPFTPYLGGGIGGAYIKGRLFHNLTFMESDTDYDDPNLNRNVAYADTITGKSNEWNLAWNLAAGLSYAVSDNVLLDLSYRYADFGETEITVDRHFTGYGAETRYFEGATSSIDLTAHELMLGLRFTGF